MKKLFTLFAFALAAASVSAQDAKITISGPWYDTEDVTIDPSESLKNGGRKGFLIVNMENSVEIQGYQFNVAVPEGANFQTWDMDYEGSKPRYTYIQEEDDEGEMVDVNRWTSMPVGAQDGSTYVGVFKNPDAKFDVANTPNIAPGNAPIGRVEIRVPSGYVQPADNKIKVYNIALTDKDGNTIVQNEQAADALTADLTVVSTGIEAVTVESLAGKEVFNLSGQRVASPTQRGIYIVNGKKLYVK